MEQYPANVPLLLLQIILQRQQVLAHKDKNLHMETLIKDPIIDDEILNQFISHKLIKIYTPDLSHMTKRSLKTMVNELFVEGLSTSQDPVTIVTLANYYYERRVKELETELIPQLKSQLQAQLQDER
ncbi:hypothetical protein NCAS_0J01410 [Naumovozyma castellii]|uniref:SWR1-complex protein 7 n=1 Tax=Naumovozyma castellii TaxID=27288 RepID=G0VKT2_NAUCA|nr:hypothetical protein NCAS_0J01410 [Naumovozyma castellii CBS 4309]CCC72120.1 hypothetical protein NCAS_0J01410 [Naumovozyma castellii CBS 4309]